MSCSRGIHDLTGNQVELPTHSANNCVHVLIDRCTRADRRRFRTARGALNFINRHLHFLTILIDRGRFRKYERRVDLLHRLLEQSTAHSDPEDDHLWGECLMGKKGDIRLSQWNSPYHALFTKVRTRDSTYTEDVPNISKRI
jgi:hypothetical protein